MTKKDYINFANQLHNVKPPNDASYGMAQWSRDITAVSTVLKRDNERFNRELFLRACHDGTE